MCRSNRVIVTTRATLIHTKIINKVESRLKERNRKWKEEGARIAAKTKSEELYKCQSAFLDSKQVLDFGKWTVPLFTAS